MQQHVLIIETEAELRLLLKRVFETEYTNFQVATAADSFKALGRLLQQHFDLVLLDQNVLGEEWLELAQTIRAVWPDSRILLLVGEEPLSLEGKQAWIFDGFIQKPFTQDQLLNAVERLLVRQN
jgi:two-component system torCAD operon response regulator TorR